MLNAGLPSCVQQKKAKVSSDQEIRDSTLPRLLYELDEAYRKSFSDVEKSRLADLCIQAASVPQRKYRILDYFSLIENNKVMFYFLIILNELGLHIAIIKQYYSYYTTL